MSALVERPKMSLAMWAALKVHIMKQREKKKQEQEADAAVERLRREQEMKRKQDAMTLEEIREQLAKFEKKLKDLKNEKHQLFLCLKQVLHEDEKRRTEEDKEANDMMHVGHSYPASGVPLGATNMYMIAGNTFMNRNQVLYKVGNAPPQQNGSIKRPRSPSPPPTAAFPQGFPSYKTHVTAYGPKPTPFSNSSNSAFYPHSTSTTSGTSSTLVVSNSTPYSAYSVPHSFVAQKPMDHLPAGFRASHMQAQGFVGPLHAQLERGNQKAHQEEKYYVQTGGISCGYPVRGQPVPQSRFQNPTPRSSSSPIQVPARKDDRSRNLPNDTSR